MAAEYRITLPDQTVLAAERDRTRQAIELRGSGNVGAFDNGRRAFNGERRSHERDNAYWHHQDRGPQTVRHSTHYPESTEGQGWTA